MNIKEYIATGILESYALGEVTPAEREEVERYLAKYPELKAELDLVEKTMEQLAMQAAIDPKASLKGSILERATGEVKIVPMTAPAVWRYATAASIAIALLTSLMAYHYYGKYEETSLALDNLIAQNQQIARDYNVVNEKLDKIKDDFSVIENAAFTRIVMKGTDKAPDAMASVYWNPGTKEVYLSIQNLKQISKDNQFQLWAIVDGKPVDAGVFDFDVDGLLKMKSINGAVAFAVTIEPRGGQASPSMETLQVIGSLPKS